MRRAVVTAVIGGYAFWAIGSGLGHQPVIVGASLSAAIKPAQPAQPAKSAERAVKPGTRIVTFGGYTVRVPASWPVYNLEKDPSRCVRYDVHAVYLGTPGPNQDCPPHVVGRVDTISIQGPTARVGPKAADNLKGPVQTGQNALASGTVVQDPDDHALALAMPEAAPRFDATYGADPVAAEHMLATVSQAPAPPAKTPGAGDAFRVTRYPPVVGPPRFPEPTNPRPVPTGNPAPALTSSGAMAGFDTCGAPSLPTMKAWRARYAAIAIYIGGQMMACQQSNLSARWVQRVEAKRWALMPTFVGLQAPCDSFSGKINPRHATSQGAAAADQAVGNAKSYGLGPGSPIYYDMEAYDHTDAGCRTAVLTFIDAWTRRMRTDGYISGIYSSADAAITDLQATTTIAGHPMAVPQAVWFALWDNARNLTGTPYLTPSVWPVATRSKQYAGNQVVEVGGISLSIDADLVAGPVVRGARPVTHPLGVNSIRDHRLLLLS